MIALAVVLSALAVPFMLGARIHFFQIAIMLAGVVAGPFSGLITGAVGAAYVASLKSDPTIIVGNALLGLFTGLLARRLRPALAGIGAWLFVQAPWIYMTGTFIFNVPGAVMQLVLVVLTIEDAACALLVDVLTSRFRLREVVFPKPNSTQANAAGK
jgi:hypothetical protein